MKERTRNCYCTAATSCYPCAGLTGPRDPGTLNAPDVETEYADCPVVPCSYSDYSDFGNCAWHSSCCDTVTVSTDWVPPTGYDFPLIDGVYSKLYVDETPSVVYMKLKESDNEVKYLHFYSNDQIPNNPPQNEAVFSDSYWDCNRNVYATSTVLDQACPDKMTEWVYGKTQQQLASVNNLKITCSTTHTKNKCPPSHPFAYDEGNKCCAAPFEDVDDTNGQKCDGSPIGLDSVCCLNAHQDESTCLDPSDYAPKTETPIPDDAVMCLTARY